MLYIIDVATGLTTQSADCGFCLNSICTYIQKIIYDIVHVYTASINYECPCPLKIVVSPHDMLLVLAKGKDPCLLVDMHVHVTW